MNLSAPEREYTLLGEAPDHPWIIPHSIMGCPCCVHKLSSLHAGHAYCTSISNALRYPPKPARPCCDVRTCSVCMYTTVCALYVCTNTQTCCVHNIGTLVYMTHMHNGTFAHSRVQRGTGV